MPLGHSIRRFNTRKRWSSGRFFRFRYDGRHMQNVFYKLVFISGLYFMTYYYWNWTELTSPHTIAADSQMPQRHLFNISEIASGFNASDVDGVQREPVTPAPPDRWRNDVPVDVTIRKFISSEDERVFILGVVGKNSTPTSGWDRYAIYGQWYDLEFMNISGMRCCFKLGGDKVFEMDVYDYNIRDYPPSLFAQVKLYIFHVTCGNPPSLPEMVSVSRGPSCRSNKIGYMKPYFAMKKPSEHLVITTKLAYMHIESDYVVSYLETAKFYGVDKVIIFVYRTLDENIKAILKYYAHIGFVDYYAIELADEEHLPRKFPPLSNQYRHDEWMVMRDALERSMGSTYFGIFDMDEFLITEGNRSYKKVLRDLRHLHKDASHFFFKNVHYLTDVRTPDCGQSCPLFKRHVLVSPDRYNNMHEKMILLTSRVDTDTICNHYVRPLIGFSRATCPKTLGYVRHYGSCNRKFKPEICSNRSTWLEDKSMIDWLDKPLGKSITTALDYLSDYINYNYTDT